ncbi:MAG TPA: SufE family protein [Alphaproteobacteria bacterium]
MSDLPDIESLQNNFSDLNDGNDKVAYLIELGAKLPFFPAELQDDAHIVRGCASRIWMDHAWENGRLHLQLTGDALIVKGLLTILFVAYRDKTPSEILERDPKTILQQLGLAHELSANRQNGFSAVARQIQSVAQFQTKGFHP